MIVQFVYFIILFCIYLFWDSYVYFDKYIISLTIFLTVLSFFSFTKERGKTVLAKQSFSVIFFFFIFSFVISFQVPLELSFGNLDLLTYNYIYDTKIVNKMVVFSGLILNVFLLGATFSCLNNREKIFKKNEDYHSIRQYKLRPLLLLLFFCFLVFLATMDKSYFDKGHGQISFDGIGASFFGLFVRLSIIYISIVLYNNRFTKNNTNKDIFSYLKLFNKSYLVTLLLIIILFLLAHNRVYIVLTFMPFVFAYFVYSRREMSMVKIFVVLSIFLFFSTFFKIYGIDNVFSNGLKIDESYMISNSYFPFTAELAGSIYAQSILFYDWYEYNFSLYGLSFLVGLFRTIPGLMNILPLDPIQYDTAIIATRQVGADYGLGTTSVVDVLVNFGFLGAIAVFFIAGYFFSTAEINSYKSKATINAYITYLSISAFILFIPRASMNDLLGTLFFNLLFIKIYALLINRK